MLTDNLLVVLIGYQIALMTIGAIYFFYKKTPKKEKYVEPIIEIEKLPNDHKGFGYISGKALILNEHGIPYLYKTYNEAKRRMKNVNGVERIVHQAWDMETQTVLVSEVRHGANQ